MSEDFDALIGDFSGPLADQQHDEGPLRDDEHQYLEESLVVVEDPVEPVDIGAELRVLKPNEIPRVGTHYVIFGGKPMPVIRSSYPVTEDDHVASQIGYDHSLKDPDGERWHRAERTLRMRYRGYLCGELKGL